jgi:uncharacterized membrane protein YbhN (UPF0104 family)
MVLTTHKAKWTRFFRYLLPLILLGLAVYVLLPQLATFEHTLQVLKAMEWWAVILAVLSQVLSYLGTGYLLTTIAAMVGQRITLLRGTMIFAGASSVGLLGGGPVGNTAVTYRWMRSSGVSAEGAVIAGWLPTLCNNGLLVLTGVFGLVNLLAAHKLTTLQVIGFGFTLALLGSSGGIIAWGVYRRAQLTALAIRLSAWWAHLRRRTPDPAPARATVERLFAAWDVLRTGHWHGPLLGAMMNTVFDMSTLYFLFVAAGHQIGPDVLLVGYGLPLLLGKVSFLPGGVGIVEGTMTVLYDGLGVPDAVTVVVILIYRFISFWLPTLLGWPMAAYLQRAYQDRMQDSA